MNDSFPFTIIQGGMGVNASSPLLANTVSRLGQLGVVSGTAVTHSLVRRLQLGDETVKAAVERFPHENIAGITLDKYFLKGGKKSDAQFKNPGMPGPKNNELYQALTVLGGFVEVDLAKQGHENPVGINLLHKIQTPHLPTLHGAMMAGADYLIMGAGVPIEIPDVLHSLATYQPTEYLLNAAKGSAQKHIPILFDPEKVLGTQQVELQKPQFLPITASKVLAMKFAKMREKIAGIIVEAPEAGGHNAPPRNKDAAGTDVKQLYDHPKDRVTPTELNEIGLPYFLAGAQGYHNSVNEAIAQGANGIQVGTLFALSLESGFAPEYKTVLLNKIKNNNIKVITNLRASPTGYPFKEIMDESSISNPDNYAQREDGQRICDLGYLREHHIDEDGKITSLCPSEPVSAYKKKGGLEEDTIDRKCLCNHLVETAGLGQTRPNGYKELPIFTLGDCVDKVAELIPRIQPGNISYCAQDVINYLKGN